jgi:hypothetical protein
MPQLGQAIEPDHAEVVTPWWRAVDQVELPATAAEPEATTLPKAMPWPVD